MTDSAADTVAMEMPAARLRKGDGLPAYGPDVLVRRHPVISVDGAMVNVLVASTPEEQPRLVRIPAGLRVDVVRPHRVGEGDEGSNATKGGGFVRSTKVAKSSGSRIAVLDLLHPDSEVPAEPGETFATLCTVHHTIKTHAGISTAQAQATHPENWCSGCTTAEQDSARERIQASVPTAGTRLGGATA